MRAGTPRKPIQNESMLRISHQGEGACRSGKSDHCARDRRGMHFDEQFRPAGRQGRAEQRVARRPPARVTALLKPDAEPVWAGSTDDNTAVVSGATAPAIPMAMTSTAGRTIVQ